MITEERKNELQTEIMQILKSDCNIKEIEEILEEMLDYIKKSSVTNVVKWFLRGAPK